MAQVTGANQHSNLFPENRHKKSYVQQITEEGLLRGNEMEEDREANLI